MVTFHSYVRSRWTSCMVVRVCAVPRKKERVQGAALWGHGTGGSRFVGSGPVGSIKILKNIPSGKLT